MYPPDFIGTHRPLQPSDIVSEAARLRCSEAIIHAFSDIEAAGSGFLPTGQPKLLFEAHQFHLLTAGRYDAGHPNISSPTWNRALYGAGGLHQYDRLREAMALAQTEALESASWGRFQIMGINYRLAAHVSVEAMIEAFCASEAAHLAAFGAFCVSTRLIGYMTAQPPDFLRLAVGYNGAGEAANGYSEKLAAAYQHYVAAGEGAVPPLSPIASQARTENPTGADCSRIAAA